MALTTYDELKDRLAKWLDRNNIDETIIEDLIDNAQRKLYREMRLGQWETRTVTNTIAGETYIQRPSRSNGIRYIKLNTNPIQVLQYETPDTIGNAAMGSYSGKPIAFTIIGDDIRLAPTPDGEYELEVSYVQMPPMLSDLVQTNWVMDNAPELLLYKTLLEASPYLGDDARIGIWQSAYLDAKNSVEEQDEDIRYPYGTSLEQRVG